MAPIPMGPSRSPAAAAIVAFLFGALGSGAGELGVEAPALPAAASARLAGASLALPHEDSPVAYAAASQRLAWSDRTGALVVWDAVRRQRVCRAAKGAGRRVAQLAFDPEGRLVATASEACERSVVELWDAASGELVAATTVSCGPVQGGGAPPDDGAAYHLVLEVCPDGIRDLAVAPGGAVIAAAGSDGPLTVLYRRPLAAPWILPRPEGGVSALAVSRDARHLAVGTEDGGLELLDLEGRTRRPLGGPGGAVRHLELLPEGPRILVVRSAGGSSRLELVDGVTGRELWAHTFARAWVRGLALAPDGRRVAVVESLERKGSRVHVLGVADGRPEGPAASALGDGVAVGWAGAEPMLLARQGSAVEVVALGASQVEGPEGASGPGATLAGRAVEQGGGGATLALRGPVRALAFDADGRRLVAADGSRLLAWDWRLDSVVASVPTSDPIGGLVAAPAGAAVLAFDPRRLTLWKVPELEPRWVEALEGVVSAAIPADGRAALVRTWDDRLLRLEFGVERQAREGRRTRAHPRPLALDRRTGTALVTDGERRLAVVDGTSLAVRGRLAVPDRTARLLVSPEGGRLAAIRDSRDDQVAFLDLPGGRVRRTLQGEVPVRAEDAVVAWELGMVVLRDQARALVVSAEDGRRLGVLDHGAAGVTGLALSPDGHRLATGGSDGSLVVWDLARVRELGPGPGGGPVMGAGAGARR